MKENRPEESGRENRRSIIIREVLQYVITCQNTYVICRQAQRQVLILQHFYLQAALWLDVKAENPGCGLAPSRMSRVGCYGMTNADWLISRPAAQILPGLLRERVRMAKIKRPSGSLSTPQSLPALQFNLYPLFFVSRVTRDASACEKHFPPVIYGRDFRASRRCLKDR